MKDKVQEMDLYPKFADTINAFLLTAAAVSANCIANNYPFSVYFTEVKKCRRHLREVIDKTYRIDKANMSGKARIMGWLLQHGFYLLIWILAKLKAMRK